MTGIEDEGFDMYIPAGQHMAVLLAFRNDDGAREHRME